MEHKGGSCMEMKWLPLISSSRKGKNCKVWSINRKRDRNSCNIDRKWNIVNIKRTVHRKSKPYKGNSNKNKTFRRNIPSKRLLHTICLVSKESL